MAFFTTADSCRLHYQTHGISGSYSSDPNRPAVVFLNGTTQTALQWRPQALYFKTDFRVVCYDGRAQGKSDRGDRSLSLDLHVDDLSALLAFLQIEKANLVGLSHGGQVALAFSVRHPEKTARLVLCGVGSEPGSRTRAIVRSWMEILATGGLEAMAWAAMPVILGSKYLEENEMILSKMVAALVARNRKESLSAHIEAMLAYPPPAVNAISNSRPCLVVSGSHDLLSPPGAARQLARITKGGYQEFENTGHNVPLEAADRFNRMCRRFLTEPAAP